MADNLSPLVNLDLVNQIYRTINAQISERVYDPNHYPAAELGDANHRYVNAYLKALNVSGNATITGNITGVKNISATTFNNLTLKANTTGFEVSGGTTSKKLTVADTTSIDKPLTISASTTISANLTVSAATKIIKELTVGADNTGTVTIKSAGAGNTTVVGPSGATAQFNVATTIGGSSANTGSVTIKSSGNSPTTIQGPSGKTAAFKVATTIGDDSNYIGAVEIKSAGTNRTTIIGPSDGTAKFLVNTTVGDTTNTGAVTIKSNGTNGTTIVGPNNSAASFLTSTTIGSSTNTGAVSIQPSGAKSLTINGPSNGEAVTLISGLYQNSAVTECSTASSANRIVQRDSNKDIQVRRVNGVELSSAGTGFTATGGTTSKTLTVNSAATLGSTASGETGGVTVKSAGTSDTTIVGPNNGKVTFTTPTDTIQGAITISDSAATPKTSTISVTAGKTLKALVSTTLGDSIQTGDITIRSYGKNPTTIIGPDNGTVTLKNGTCLVEADATTVANDSKIVQRSNGNINVGTVNSAGISGKDSVVTLSNGSTTASIQKSLTVSSTTTLGAANTGSITVRSGGTGNTTIIGPESGEAKLIEGDYTDSAKTANSSDPKVGTLLKVKAIKANTFLAGPESGTTNAAPTYRKITSSDLTNVNAGSASKVETVSATADTTQYVSFVDSNNESATAETVYTNANLTYNPYSGTLSASIFSGALSGNASSATKASNSTIKDWNVEKETTYYVPAIAGIGDSQPLYASTNGVKITRKVDNADPVYHLYAGAVHNAVWNDLADCIEVPEDTDLEFGYCYSWNGNKVEKTSRKSKNCIGIHSNTAGLFMGEKPVRTIQAAVAGFALAYTDKIYPEGTPLTWSDDGKLTKCTVLKRVLHPERVIATFYKEEKQESWHGVKVDNRHWVKIR